MCQQSPGHERDENKEEEVSAPKYGQSDQTYRHVRQLWMSVCLMWLQANVCMIQSP